MIHCVNRGTRGTRTPQSTVAVLGNISMFSYKRGVVAPNRHLRFIYYETTTDRELLLSRYVTRRPRRHNGSRINRPTVSDDQSCCGVPQSPRQTWGGMRDSLKVTSVDVDDVVRKKRVGGGRKHYKRQRGKRQEREREYIYYYPDFLAGQYGAIWKL